MLSLKGDISNQYIDENSWSNMGFGWEVLFQVEVNPVISKDGKLLFCMMPDIYILVPTSIAVLDMN